MSKIVDFKCTYDNSVGIDKQVTLKTGLEFPKAYKHWDSMALLSKELKEHEKSLFCELPFCHTVEGEAMGGIINFGDENIGPRAKDYICSSCEDLLSLPEIDYSNGRIAEVLKACSHLRENGENVVLNVSGPFTIMNVLIDQRHVFKSFRKNPDSLKALLDKFQTEILRFIEKAKKSGVNMISYADSSGALNILGPKLSEQVVELFTYPLLKKMEGIIGSDMIVLLCPKTSFALIGTGKAEWEDISLGSALSYPQGCVQAIGKAKFVGQMCVKNKGFMLSEGTIKALRLL